MADMVRWGVLGGGGIARRRTIPEGIVPAAAAELAASPWYRAQLVEREDLRLEAAAAAGDSAGAHQILLSVLPYLKETPAHRPVARRALAVLAMARPEGVTASERAQLEGRLRRIARAGP